MEMSSVFALAGIIVTIVIFAIGLRRQVRKERLEAELRQQEAQQKAIREAVQQAVAPLVDRVKEVTQERDYYRERVDDLQDQINQINRKSAQT